MKKTIVFSQDRRSGKLRSTTKRQPNFTDTQVGESIRAYRLIAGMSQSELAGQLGVSFQQVQKYEKGANRVGAGRLPQIAKILNIPISALFKDHVDTSDGRQPEYAAPVKFITDPTILKLLTSYADITDRTTRRCISELVDQVAKAARKENQR